MIRHQHRFSTKSARFLDGGYWPGARVEYRCACGDTKVVVVRTVDG